MSGSRTPRWKAVVVAAAAALLVGLLGGLATTLDPWYYSLASPSWKPPDWLFGPAWTLIFALTAIAGVLAWRASTDRRQRERILLAFALNGFLNVVWSLLFFRLQRPDWALIEVAFLWLSIVWMIRVVRGPAPVAGWLLAPYLAWVAFAGLLNAAIVDLNAPFGGP